MGASSTDELLKSNSSQKERYSKHVHDNVHGNIYLDPVLSAPSLNFRCFRIICKFDSRISCMRAFAVCFVLFT